MPLKLIGEYSCSIVVVCFGGTGVVGDSGDDGVEVDIAADNFFDHFSIA
jgi:hypothetical protein